MPRVKNKGNFKHGMKGSPEYRSWCHAKGRCLNPNDSAYHLYGGRGITMCDRWLNDFAAFLEDMGIRPSIQHSLDRIDTNGPYSPENCRWATRTEQVRNRRTTVKVGGEVLGETAERLGVRYTTLHKRLMDGRDLTPDSPNMSIRHLFDLGGEKLTLRDIATKINKSYRHVYHHLVTKGRPVAELLRSY